MLNFKNVFSFARSFEVNRYFYWRFCFAIGLNLLVASLEIASFVCLLVGFSSATGKSLSFPLTNSPFFWIGLALLAQALRSLLAFCALSLVSRISGGIQDHVQKHVNTRIFRADFLDISRYQCGELTALSQIPMQVVPILLEGANQFIVSGLMLLALFVFMNYISIKLTLSTLLVFSFFLALQRFVIKKIRTESACLEKKAETLAQQTTECFLGLRHLHLFDSLSWVLQKIGKTSLEITRYRTKLLIWNGSIPSINEMITVCAVATILAVGYSTVKENAFSLFSLLLTFIALTYRFASRAQMLWGSCAAISSCFPSIERLKIILEVLTPKMVESNRALPAFQSQIELQRVSFSYPGKTVPALKEISMTIPKGSLIGIVGHSGSGKSTFIDLFCRLFDPSSGQILIDGISLTAVALKEWRKQLAVVSQDLFLIADTIEENIRFGADISSLDIVKAAQMAHAHEFIMQLPQGYQTRIGELGLRLSGGEKQRLSLARALAKQAPILIFDELTSHLDAYNELKIWQLIDQLRANHTILIVSHQIAALTDADQIVVIADGQIQEIGKHRELIEQEGHYSHLWKTQILIKYNEKEIMAPL